MSWRSITLVLAVLVLSKAAAAQVDPVAECDRLTEQPGYAVAAEIDAAAVPACSAAVAANPREPRLRYQLGRALESAGDSAAALAAYRKAAAADFAPALTAIAYFHEHGIIVARDLEQAFAMYRQAAALGDPDGAMMAGYFYEVGQGVAADPAEAARYYLQAAEGGVAWAANAIGDYYEQGIGVAADQAEAVRWYRVAANAGDPTGLANLARVYFYGLGVPKDEAQAARLYRMGADGGDLEAAERLARMLHYGIGVAEDLPGAETLYRQVIAGTGSTSVRNSLAWLFAEQGIKLDEAEMLAREAVRSTPDPLPTRANYVDTLAWVLFKQGRLGEAATLLEGIATIEPRRPAIVAHLGDVYAALDRIEDARAAWRDALAILEETHDDGNFDRAAIEAKLAE